jgi:hypothetical protein
MPRTSAASFLLLFWSASRIARQEMDGTENAIEPISSAMKTTAWALSYTMLSE